MGKYEYKFNPLSDEFDLVGANLHFRASVDTYSNLPITGNEENDARFTEDTDKLYTWSIPSSSGILTDWVEIGSMAAHALTHQDSGGDEINVAGLSGELADPQIPKAHTHIEVDITDLDKYTQTEMDNFFEGEVGGKKQVHWDRVTNKPTEFNPSSHTHLETDITDLEHYDSGDFASDFSAADLANLASKSYNDLTDKPDLSDLHFHANKAELDWVSDGAHDVRTDNPHGITPAQIGAALTTHYHDDRYYTELEIDNLLSGKANLIHSHVESDITDLDHNALKINGIPVDAPASGEDGEVLTYNESLNKYELKAVLGTGDMLKSVYDINDNNIVDKAEALNDGSSGGGNNVTAQEAREHLDDTSNPHNVTAAQIGESSWLQSVIPNTPSTVTRLFGKSAEGFRFDVDVRLLRLHIQYYSEHVTQSKLRIRVYRYDVNAATDRLILSVTQSAIPIGYHNIEDITPDTNYYDIDSSAGDTIWIEVDNGVGGSAQRVREITISLKYMKI